ncbi:helix-turn-helix domain-containing protein [Streptomyces sp. NPDC016562]|uniref:helix-turn-helix domain-containing protein n=1 Tax=Streptomyces sp. NPDC016562 TaxID=3364966 RepID=UPI003701B3D5
MAIRNELVAQIDGVTMRDVHQPWVGRAGRWTPLVLEEDDALCLYRSGWRRRTADGVEEYLDATTAYTSRRGTEEQFAGTADVEISWITLTPGAYEEHLGRVMPAHGWVLRPDAAFDYRHRRLVAGAARGIDASEAAEGLLLLLDALPRYSRRPHLPPPRSWVRHRVLAAGVQELLAAEPATGIEELARALATSPGHLSRVFRQVTGRTVSAYRNELRVRRALDLLARGAGDLARLAADLGFSDHAHLTRTVKRHTGHVPSVVRAELATVRQGPGGLPGD